MVNSLRRRGTEVDKTAGSEKGAQTHAKWKKNDNLEGVKQKVSNHQSFTYFYLKMSFIHDVSYYNPLGKFEPKCIFKVILYSYLILKKIIERIIDSLYINKYT